MRFLSSMALLPPLVWGVLFVATGSAALALVLALPVTGPRPPLAAGDIAPRTYKAPRTIPSFLSEALTEERRRQAAASVSDVLAYDPGVSEEQSSRLHDAIEHISVIRESDRLTSEQRVQALRQLNDVTLGPQAIETVLAMSETAWQQAAQEAERLLRQISLLRFSTAQTLGVQGALGAMLPPGLTSEQRLVVQDLVRRLVRPTLVPDPDETARARQIAADQVPPALISLSRGETIARDGQVLTAAHLERLTAAGLLQDSFRWREMLGSALLCLVLAAVTALFMARNGAPHSFTARRLLLVALLMVGTVAAAKIALPGHPAWVYVFPFAAAPMLIAILFDAGTAVLLAAVLAVLTAFAADYAPELGGYAPSNSLEALERIAFFFLGAVAGVLRAATARRLSQFFAAGAAVSLTNVAVLLAFWLLLPDREHPALSTALAAALGNGALAAALAVGTFVVAGHLFGFTTSVQLLELAQPDHPLLRRLLTEAPGTYYHSLLVSNLAERAAEAVGADPLLARVGAYYHDVGKLANPGFFIENQRSGHNPHDHLTPQESATVIVAHVRDGLRLAREYRLPPRVQDFVAMHHGTRLAVYFYHKAQQALPADGPQPDPRFYSYPGPRPRGKEPALVMLADSVEAATRSLQQPAPEDIDALVERIVAERIAERQLDDSDLTLRDLERAKAAYKEALRGIFHPRIAYPQGVPGTAERAEQGAPPPSELIRLFDQRRRRGAGE